MAKKHSLGAKPAPLAPVLTNAGVSKAPSPEPEYRPLRLLALVAVTLVLWCVILPGAVAYGRGVFFDAAVRQRALALDSSAAAAWRGYEDKVAQARDLEALATARLRRALATDTAEVSGVAEVLARPPVAFAPPFQVGGFERNTTTFIWLAHYIGISTLLVWRRGRPRLSRVAPAGLLVFVAFNWPNWVRNTLLGSYETGRRVYSYVHADIDGVSFVLQELRILVMMLLLAAVWDVLDQGLRAHQRTLAQFDKAPTGLGSLVNAAKATAELVSRWQVESVLLALAYIPWTWFFWLEVGKAADYRYMVSAFTMHLLWLGTWVLLSMPLWRTLRVWSAQRFRLLAKLSAEPREEAKLDLELAERATPVGPMTVIGTSVAAGVSFLIPLLGLLR